MYDSVESMCFSNLEWFSLIPISACDTGHFLKKKAKVICIRFLSRRSMSSKLSLF